MEGTHQSWSKEDLKIYILIYCANADFSESKIEVDFIKSKVQTSNFEILHTEFEKDNDYQSIEKIKSTIQRLGYSDTETDTLLTEIKSLFLSDDNYDVLEQNLFRGLSHILKD